MPLLFNEDDLDAQARLRDAFDPDGRAEPAARCCRRAAAAARRCASPRAHGCERGRRDSRGRSPTCATPSRLCRSARDAAEVGGAAAAGRNARCAYRPASSRYEPADMTVTVRAGTRVGELDAALAEHGQECPLDPRDPAATVGGVLALRSLRAPAAARSGRSATGSSRSASSPATAGW